MKTEKKTEENRGTDDKSAAYSRKRERLVTDILAVLHAAGGGCQNCTSCTR